MLYIYIYSKLMPLNSGSFIENYLCSFFYIISVFYFGEVNVLHAVLLRENVEVVVVRPMNSLKIYFV